MKTFCFSQILCLIIVEVLDDYLAMGLFPRSLVRTWPRQSYVGVVQPILCLHSFQFLIFKIVLFCAFLHVTCKSQCYPALCHKNMKLIRHLFTHYLWNFCMVHSCILTYVPLCVLGVCVSTVLISDMSLSFLERDFVAYISMYSDRLFCLIFVMWFISF